MRKDLTGQRFGKLVAIRPTTKRTRDKNVIWELQCDCGTRCEAPTSELVRGRVTSCGCGRGQTHALDLAGRRFGKLVAVRRVGSDGNGCALWECRCDCGNTCVAASSALAAGAKQSCGCVVGGKPHDLVGQRFGKLVAIRPAGRRCGYALWRCACDCGNECFATTGQLTSGRTTSCGCDSPVRSKREAAARHIPVTGQRFGRLAVVDINENDVRCVCDCDRVVRVALDDLRAGTVTACGQCN